MMIVALLSFTGGASLDTDIWSKAFATRTGFLNLTQPRLFHLPAVTQSSKKDPRVLNNGLCTYMYWPLKLPTVQCSEQTPDRYQLVVYWKGLWGVLDAKPTHDPLF